MQPRSILDDLKQLLKQKRSRRFYAKRLNITQDEVDELFYKLKEERRDRARDEAETAVYISALEERVLEHNVEQGTIKSTVVTDYEPKSIEELYSLHKVDAEKYKISNYWSKLKTNGKYTSSVFATAKKPEDYTVKDFAKWLEGYNPKPIKVETFKKDYWIADVDIEISISDFHLAKKTVEHETIGGRKLTYLTVLSRLVEKVARSFNINKVVFVISNDFFHSDNYQGTTTNGTPQDVVTDYNYEYEVGFDLLATAITYLKSMSSEVEVVLVQGNHDRTKSFYVAHALQVYFKEDKNIRFQRQDSTTKHVVLGNTFIGYHHGNCKIEDLPLLFATGATAADFGNSQFREVHTGDKHYYMAKEIKGVRIQQMPSLSGTDRWHRDNNYVHNLRAALVLIYDQQLGKIGEFEERI